MVTIIFFIRVIFIQQQLKEIDWLGLNPLRLIQYVEIGRSPASYRERKTILLEVVEVTMCQTDFEVRIGVFECIYYKQRHIFVC